MGNDPRSLKQATQECWASSPNAAAFAASMKARGLYIAKGDRRAHVIVTYEGEVVSLARAVGIKTQDIAAKLGPPGAARTVEETKADIACEVTPRLRELVKEAKAERLSDLRPLDARRLSMAEGHGSERQKLSERQQARFASEARGRAARFRSGVAGIWDRLTGRHSAVRKENERETYLAVQRDRAQRDALVSGQLQERRDLQREIAATRERHASKVLDLFRDLSRQRDASAGPERLRRTEISRQSVERNRGTGPSL